MEERLEKIRALMADEAFVRELFSKENIEDAHDYFEVHGVEMTLEEMDRIAEAARNGGLTDPMEEEVALIAGAAPPLSLTAKW